MNTTPDVPRLRLPRSGRWLPSPSPMLAAALSPAPAKTGVPAGSPVAAAASAWTVPTWSCDAWTGGNSDLSMPTASRMPSAQSPRCRSKQPVPAASLGSVAKFPVSRNASQSLGSSTCCVRSKAPGSCSRSQSSLGSWKPVTAGLPVRRISSASPTAQPGGLGGGTLIVPQDRVVNGLTRSVHSDQAVHLTGERHAQQLLPLSGCQQFTADLTERLVPGDGLLLAPAGPGGEQRIGPLSARVLAPLRVDQHTLKRSRAQVDTQDVSHRQRTPSSSSTVS